ncbi:nagb/rpia/CoA transferase-like protein, partial [Armillaria borealis]
LFIEFVTLFPHAASSFSELETELIRQGHQFVTQALSYPAKIAELAFDFIKDDSVEHSFVTTFRWTRYSHSYSRVVMQTLLWAHKRKRIPVFVTEARPQKLTAAGIPTTVVLDSAVAYCMDMVDFVLVGSEAVVESGGLINAVGSNQIAIIAKAANKPFYALAESYKFHRLFPLSQYDLPSHTPDLLSFSLPKGRHLRNSSVNPSPKPSTSVSGGSILESSALEDASDPAAKIKNSQEQIARNNPSVDYTRSVA